MQKYKAKKTEYDGIMFDSKKEAQRYAELKILERAGVIKNLQRQVTYTLIPAQRIDGKVAERACTYKADFTYEQCGQQSLRTQKALKRLSTSLNEN